MKIIKNSFIALMLLSYASMAISMEQANPSRGFLKKSLARGSNWLHWSIAAAPCWAFAAYQFLGTDVFVSHSKTNLEMEKLLVAGILGNDAAKKFERELAQQKEFIQEEIKSQGYKEWKNIDLLQYDTFAATSNFDSSKYMVYDRSLVQEALDEKNSLLNKMKSYLGLSPNENAQNKVRGILSHELVHLKNNHAEKHIILGITLPFLTYALTKKPGAKNSLNVLYGMRNLAINAFGLWTFAYTAEREADEGVVNDPKALRALAEAMRQRANRPDNAANTWQNKIDTIIDPHPHLLKRAQRFEQRAAELELKENKK